MNIKEFQKSAKIVIVDDEEEDGEDIRKALASKNIASVFYHIRNDRDLPSKPISNLRVIFLDLHFAESNPLATDRQNASIPLRKLSKFVTKNSFYILVIWSSHSQGGVYREFITQLSREDSFAQPIKFFEMDKLECGRNPSKIINKINEGFLDIPVFKIFLDWEEMVSNAINQSLKDLISGKTNLDLSKLLNTLASGLGGNDHPHKKTPKQALYALNLLLEDGIGKELEMKDFGTIYQKIENGGLSEQDKGALNMAMVFDKCLPENGSGSLYIKKDKKIKKQTVEIFLESLTIPSIGTAFDKIKCFHLDVTPLCDSALNKGNSYFIDCILYPTHYTVIPATNPPIRKIGIKKGFIYTLEKVFFFEGESYKFSINLRSYRSDNTKKSKRTLTMRLRDSITIDIQHQIAAHLSRPGHIWY